jgi:uncharacterized protein YlxW (UPF0749 family)
MFDDLNRHCPRLSFRFTIRSLLILTTFVAAFFGGRASMMPMVEAERMRAKAAEELARAAQEQSRVVDKLTNRMNSLLKERNSLLQEQAELNRQINTVQSIRMP